MYRTTNSRWILYQILTSVNRNIKLSKKIHTTSRFCYLMAKNKEYLTNNQTTVDKDDVLRHTKQMREWWDANGPMRGLHNYNFIRVPFIRDGLLFSNAMKKVESINNVEVLDVGCGGGILSEPLASLGAKVTGIDASPELIQCAIQHSTANASLKDKPTYICTTVEEHAETNSNKYDGVVASEIIEHVNNKELFIQSCLNVLKPGGRLLLTTPNRTKYAEFTLIYLAEKFNLIPKGTHQIEKFITHTELSALLEKNNCRVDIVQGISFNLFTEKWALSNFKTFAYALRATKVIPRIQN